MKKYKSFSNYVDEQLKKDPELKKEYDELQTEYYLIEELIRIRKSQGITQQELSEKTGINQSLISRLERGTLNPSIKFLNRVAKGLNKKVKITFE